MTDKVREIDPSYLRRVAQAPDVKALKVRAYRRLGLKAGDSVVDVGCGPAIDTLALAKIVGPKGSVIGIDGDPKMIVEANKTAMQAGVGAFIRHQQADASKLPLGTGEMDACLCERVLQHIKWEGCQLAVNEMLRVVKPGGRLVIIDTDWATLSIASGDPLLERRIAHEHSLGFENPYSGRYLPSLLRNAFAPVDDLTVETTAIQLPYESVAFLLGATLRRAVFAGRMTAPEAQRFVEGLNAAREYRVFFAQLSIVMVTATRRKA